MNYKYRIEEKDFIFSFNEHEAIKKAIEEKRSIIFLRNGGLAINVSFIRWVKETDDLTDLEIKERDERLRLPPEKRDDWTFSSSLLSRKEYAGFEKVMSESEKECIGCGEIHFIPENKIYCLSCLMKEKNGQIIRT